MTLSCTHHEYTSVIDHRRILHTFFQSSNWGDKVVPVGALCFIIWCRTTWQRIYIHLKTWIVVSFNFPSTLNSRSATLRSAGVRIKMPTLGETGSARNVCKFLRPCPLRNCNAFSSAANYGKRRSDYIPLRSSNSPEGKDLDNPVEAFDPRADNASQTTFQIGDLSLVKPQKEESVLEESVRLGPSSPSLPKSPLFVDPNSWESEGGPEGNHEWLCVVFSVMSCPGGSEGRPVVEHQTLFPICHPWKLAVAKRATDFFDWKRVSLHPR